MSSVRFEKCTHSCKYYHNQDISSSPPKKFPYALLQSILYSHLHCQEMNGLLSLSFCLSGMSYKFNHRVCILLVCLLSLSILLLKFIQVVACNGSLFPFIDGQYYMVGLFHDLFTLAPVDGHLSCLQFCNIMNKAGMKNYVQTFEWTWVNSFPLGKYVLELLGSMLSVIFNFKELDKLFLHRLYYFAFPPTTVIISDALHILSST